MQKLYKIFKSKITHAFIAAGLLSYIILRFEIDVKKIFSYIENFNFIIAGLIIIILIRPFIFNSRWKIFLQHSGIDEKIFSLIIINWKSVFYAIFLPFSTASDAFKMYFIEKKYPEKRGFAGASVLADRMVGLVLFCLIACIGSFFLPDTALMFKIRTAVYIATGVIFLIIFIVTNNKIYEKITPLLNKIPFLNFIFQYLTKVHKSLTILPYKKIIPKVVVFILLFQLINIVLVYFVFLSVNKPIPLYYHLVFIPIIQTITLLPVSISGFGFREGIFIYFYSIVNIPPEISFSISITYFLLMSGVPALIGGLIILYEKIKPKKILQVYN